MEKGGERRPRDVTGRYILLDTDVVSFFFASDSRAKLYEPHIRGLIPVLSFQTVGELLRWPAENNWGVPRRLRLQEYIHNYAVIQSSRELVEKWAQITSAGKASGHETPGGDAWVGATAVLYEIPLATNNRRNFEWMQELGLILRCEAPIVRTLDGSDGDKAPGAP